MITVNDSVFFAINGKICKGCVVEIWNADQYHRAGFRAHFTTKYGLDEYIEFKIDDIGETIFLNKKDCEKYLKQSYRHVYLLIFQILHLPYL